MVRDRLCAEVYCEEPPSAPPNKHAFNIFQYTCQSPEGVHVFIIHLVQSVPSILEGAKEIKSIQATEDLFGAVDHLGFQPRGPS